jgi:hypothetical protein
MNFKLTRKLDDQDRVLARKSHQHHQPHLHENVVVAIAQPHAEQRGTHANRHDQDDRQRQCAAFIQRREHQKHPHPSAVTGADVQRRE